MRMNPRDVPIPATMRHLEVDHRGYAIPWGVYRDPSGRPHFQINDENIRRRSMDEDLCGICGGRLWRGRWFVGGPLSAFHPDGTYIDPPMHHECMQYALKVCPYLAAPNYGKNVGTKTLPKEHSLIMVDPTVIPDRPAMFVGVMAIDQIKYVVGLQSYIKPKKPFRRLEFWREGRQLPEQEGLAFAAAVTWPGRRGAIEISAVAE